MPFPAEEWSLDLKQSPNNAIKTPRLASNPAGIKCLIASLGGPSGLWRCAAIAAAAPVMCRHFTAARAATWCLAGLSVGNGGFPLHSAAELSSQHSPSLPPCLVFLKMHF
ncbi:unnamed protein product [Pleuronectes platessa]|uniref:Uncharacterized protein n=1 Tax=Pleuronectes platessa TaxID=8262 RepID=A0A9N7Z1F8_PLEPL|nr:unnamed protein product [Pleuronectes platessa]